MLKDRMRDWLKAEMLKGETVFCPSEIIEAVLSDEDWSGTSEDIQVLIREKNGVEESEMPETYAATETALDVIHELGATVA